MLSELRRKVPDPGVVAWAVDRAPASMFISALSIGEIRRGIECLSDERRRLALVDWLERELPLFFGNRVLAVDTGVADRWGRLLAAAGRPLPVIDSLLAATALEHDLVLVTRNLRDFGVAGLRTMNPWTGA